MKLLVRLQKEREVSGEWAFLKPVKSYCSVVYLPRERPASLPLYPRAPRLEQVPSKACEIVQNVICFSLPHTAVYMDAGTCFKLRHIYPTGKFGSETKISIWA